MARILIADDDELIAELASTILIDAGHACGWVRDATQTWQLLKTKRPDLLLLDQDMPGMSGSTLLRKIRVSSEFYDLPTIMFTAMSGKRDVEQALYAGAQGFISKPFTETGLKNQVRSVLEERRRHPRHVDLLTWLSENSGGPRQVPDTARRAL